MLSLAQEGFCLPSYESFGKEIISYKHNKAFSGEGRWSAHLASSSEVIPMVVRLYPSGMMTKKGSQES